MLPAQNHSATSYSRSLKARRSLDFPPASSNLHPHLAIHTALLPATAPTSSNSSKCSQKIPPGFLITRFRVLISLAVGITVISSLYASTTPLSQSPTPLYYHNTVFLSTVIYFYLATVCYAGARNGTLAREEWRAWGILIAGGFSTWYHVSAYRAWVRLEKKLISEWREGNLWRSVLLAMSLGLGIFAYLG